MFRRFRGLRAAAMLAAVLVLGLWAGIQGAPTSAAPSGAALAQRSPRLGKCAGEISSTLSTAQTTVCDPATVRVDIEPYCPICPGGMHVIFVHTDTPQARWQEQESRKVLEDMERWAERYMAEDAILSAAVVEYDNGGATTRVKVTDNLNQVYGQLTADTTYNPRGKAVEAAKLALRELDAARRKSKDGPCEVVIMYAYTKSHYADQRAILLDAANMIKAKAKLMVGCPMDPGAWYCRGPEPEMPTSTRYFSKYNESGKIRRMVQDEMSSFPKGMSVRTMDLVQVLPADLQYVTGSATGGEPALSAGEAGQTILKWSWAEPKVLVPISVTYQVHSEAPASYAITGELTVMDMGRLMQKLPAPEQVLAVDPKICVTPTPTATDTPVPPTDTPTPTSTHTPSPTATDTPTVTLTPTPSRYTIYLPFVIHEKEECVPESNYADVILVIDMSTSMYRATNEGGASKHLAALTAARQFLDQLSLEPDARQRHDQVAIVGFNDEAWTQVGLTTSRERANAALASLPDRIAQGTRLDLALAQGQAVLDAGPRQSLNRPTIILLTDGLPNRVPFGPGSSAPDCPTQECTVLRQAAAAKAAGSRVFTIGLGEDDDVLRDLLRGAASDPGDFYFAPETEDLAGIYRQIAGRITECP